MDYLDELFPDHKNTTQAEINAGLELAMIAHRAEKAAASAERARLRCPRCMGEGRLSQFTHRKGGECFLCGGSGVFSGYSA